MRRTILFVTHEMVPLLPRAVVAGGGVRAWGLANALECAGHRVLWSLPEPLVARFPDLPPETREIAHAPWTVTDLVWRVRPDLVLFEQWGALALLGDAPCPVVVDLPAPLVIENAFRGRGDLAPVFAAKLAALRKCDHMVVGSEGQKQYLLPWLALLGFDLREPPVCVVPMLFSPEAPPRLPPAEPVFVFGGMIWPWQDPYRALGVLFDELERAGRGTVRLFCGAHPGNFGVGAGRDYNRQQPDAFPREFLDRLARCPRARLEGLVDRESLDAAYARATCAFDVMRHTVEREVAFPTRTADYLWRGIPVIHGAGAELAGVIARAGAGWIVDPHDDSAIRAAVREALSDPQGVERRAAAAARLARERLNWTTGAGALLRWIAEPRRAPRNTPHAVRLGGAADRAVRLLDRVRARAAPPAREKGLHPAAS